MMTTYPSGYREYRRVENMRRFSIANKNRRRDRWWEDQQIRDEYIRSLGLDPLSDGYGFTVEDELQEFERDLEALREAFRQRAREQSDRSLGRIFDWQYGDYPGGRFDKDWNWITNPMTPKHRVIKAVNKVTGTIALWFYLFKFLVCWLMDRQTSKSYPDAVELACYNCGLTYYESEPYGDTAEVGHGVLKNWFWNIGSL